LPFSTRPRESHNHKLMCTIFFSYSIPFQAWTGSSVSERLRLPEYLDNQHMKVVRLSALSTGRLYPQKIPVVLISIRGWVGTRAIVRPKGLCQWKIPMTPNGIQIATFQLVAQWNFKIHVKNFERFWQCSTYNERRLLCGFLSTTVYSLYWVAGRKVSQGLLTASKSCGLCREYELLPLRGKCVN